MKAARRFSLLIPLILLGSATISLAQTPDPQAAASPAEDTSPVIVRLSPTPTPSPTPRVSFAKNVARDQKTIWTSPFHLKREDVKWLVPLGLTAAALIATDRHTSAWVDRNGSLITVSHKVSLGGSSYTTAGIAAGLYLIGRSTHNTHAAETGKLSIEALIGAGLVVAVLKPALGRSRPNEDSGRGHFFDGGRAFPSGHATAAWAIATVIASEYKDHPFIKYGAYALAVAISMSRFSGRNHFLGDVFAGSAIGFGIGRYVYATRH